MQEASRTQCVWSRQTQRGHPRDLGNHQLLVKDGLNEGVTNVSSAALLVFVVVVVVVVVLVVYRSFSFFHFEALFLYNQSHDYCTLHVIYDHVTTFFFGLAFSFSGNFLLLLLLLQFNCN